jgi:S-methylmethionine-dependent homocysteine/selenocysteine methylase
MPAQDFGSAHDSAVHRHQLPQLRAAMFLADGGIETSLIYDDGIELVDFAAFTLLDTAEGRAALVRYFEAYAAIAARDSVGVVLETATWRASPDWVARQGLDPDRVVDLNLAAVDLLLDIRARYETAATPIVISGCIGPRGDGYQPGSLMSAEEARRYHATQANTFARSPADLITAITMTYPAEAIGIARAARDEGMPVVISFTVETDGTLPTGDTLADAIEAVDAATDACVAYYMVNCAHPTHFAGVLQPGSPWTGRIRGIRANASTMSHAELDQATELDAGDPIALARSYRDLRERVPHLVVLGGCCGTNHEHIAAISTACAI